MAAKSKSSRFCGCLLTLFRIVQLLLSVCVLCFGGYITYIKFSIASDAHDLETTLLSLQNSTVIHAAEKVDGDIKDFVDTLIKVFVPVLQAMQQVPTRAIVLMVVGLWALCTITYLFIAQKRGNGSKTNKRAIRVPLEIVTLILWIGGTACAILLALQYGILALTGGPAAKIALTGVKPLIIKVVKNTAQNEGVIRSLDLVNDLITIGALSILAVVGACVCTVISSISLIIACCVSGKEKKQKQNYTPCGADTVQSSIVYERQDTRYSAMEKSQPSVPVTPKTPATYTYHVRNDLP